MAEFEEIFEGTEVLKEIEGIDEMGELGDGLEEADRGALEEAEAGANEQFADFNEEEIEVINNNTPEEVQIQVDDAIDNSGVEDLSQEGQEAARGEGLDPEQPRENLKTRLKKVWKQYGSFLKGIGKFSVKGVGLYFKWKFIMEVTESILKDLHDVITILRKSKNPSNNSKLLTNFLTFLTQVERITEKIDTPLKIVTGAATTTDKDGLANLFATYFTLHASEDLTQTGTALLQAGMKVKTNNGNAYKALCLPKNPTEDDLEKLTKATISSAIAKLSASDLQAFTNAASNHKENLDKYLTLLDASDDNVKKLKAALTLPPNYLETFHNLETFITSGSKNTTP
jgi:hypothetical protein